MKRTWTKVGEARVRRGARGIPQVEAPDFVELARAVGWCHACDRPAQLERLRRAVRGRLSRWRPTASHRTTDEAVLEAGIRHHAADEQGSPEVEALVEAYRDGITRWNRTRRQAPDVWLAGLAPGEWDRADVLAAVKLVAWRAAWEQAQLGRWLVESVHGGVDLELLRELFRPHLDALDPGVLEGLAPPRSVLPFDLGGLARISTLRGSNVWAVSAARAAGEGALLAADVHLPLVELPPPLAQVVARVNGEQLVGATLAGLPLPVMGRTDHLAAAFGHGCMDQFDWIVEEIVDGRARRREGSEAVRVRKVRGPTGPRRVYETSLGVLETDEPPAGRVLCRSWSLRRGGATEALASWLALWRSADVEEGAEAARAMPLSADWVLADRSGRVAHQQSGWAARSGLVPLAGWETLVEPASDLAGCVDPPGGLVVVANAGSGQPGVRVARSPHRARRARDLLGETEEIDLEVLRTLQNDRVSPRARAYLDLIRDHLPDDASAAALSTWDGEITRTSRAAVLLERVVQAMMREVFGRLFGRVRWGALARHTTLPTAVHHLLDRIVLGPDDPRWFGSEGRNGVIARVLDRELGAWDGSTWAQEHPFALRDRLWGGRLPWVDAAVSVDGAVDTLAQQVWTERQGETVLVASAWRFVTDLASGESRSIVPGGPSGRIGSPWRRSELEAWSQGRLQELVSAVDPGSDESSG